MWQKRRIAAKIKYEKGKNLVNISMIILGIAGVVFGAWLLIESSIIIAEIFQIPKFIIALSMVAVGTSVPELVVSAMASYKDESDIAVGNVLGSNVFNILLILGIAAIVIPLNANTFDSLIQICILMIVTIVMLPVLLTQYIISKREGVLLLVGYSVYIFYTFYSAI